MAAPDKKAPAIFNLHLDLLHPQGLPEKLPLRFIKWLINYGRFIAIVVELIVMVTFIARFKFDADLSQTKEKINEQIPFIQNLSQTEASIRQTQYKLSLIRKNFTASSQWSNILKQISQQLPTGVKLTGLNLDATAGPLHFRLNGTSSSDVALAAMLSGLKSTQGFRNISLSNISFDNGQLVFAIQGDYQ